MTTEELKKEHPLYSAFKAEWLFYIRSYLGGKFYRDGNYLLQHPFESLQNYTRRKSIAYLYNYCQPVVDALNGYLFKKPPQRFYGGLSTDASPPRNPSTLFDSFWWDCDYDGSSLDQFIRNAQRMSSIYGRISVLVDKSSLPATTQASALANDVRPYLSIITPENLVDWEYQRSPYGRMFLNRIKIRDVDIPSGKISARYTIWDTMSWETWEVDRQNRANRTAAGEHGLGEIPIVTVYNKRSGIRMIGLSDIKDIADINKNIYYLCSDAKEIIENTAFPMLAMPQMANVDEELVVGSKNILEFDPDKPNGSPFWLEPPHSSLNEIREWVMQDAQEIARVALMGGMRNIETSTQPWSGVSIESQSQQLISVLVEKADNIEQAELDIMRLYCKWENMTYDGDVRYPRDFSVRDATITLQNAISAGTQNISSAIFERERQKIVVTSTLPFIEEQTRVDIFDEIDTADLNTRPVTAAGMTSP